MGRKENVSPFSTLEFSTVQPPTGGKRVFLPARWSENLGVEMGRGRGPAAPTLLRATGAGTSSLGGGDPSRVTRLRLGRNPGPSAGRAPPAVPGWGVGENVGCFCQQERLHWGATFPLLTGNADLTREHVHALRRCTKEKAWAVPWGQLVPSSCVAAYPWGRGHGTSVFTEQDARCAFPGFQGFSLISAHYLWLPSRRPLLSRRLGQWPVVSGQITETF